MGTSQKTGHFKNNPTIHYFQLSRHTWLMIAHKTLTGIPVKSCYSVAVTISKNWSIKTEKHIYLHIDEPEFFYSNISIHVEELIEFTHLQIKNNNCDRKQTMAYVRWKKVNKTLFVHGQQVIILLNKQGISMQYSYSFSSELKMVDKHPPSTKQTKEKTVQLIIKPPHGL